MNVPDLVLIGRNEGARLVAALEAAFAAQAQGLARRIVYVDSGSSDGSVAEAHKAGADVVELSTDRPFTAARARNEGFELLEETGGAAEFVQFIDGDCQVQPEWLIAGTAELTSDERLGLATGWSVEIDPDASIYNAMAGVEWRRPPGIIKTCGGNMMVRSAAFREVGGFRNHVIAAEDDEFCCRLRKAGWVLKRLPIDMTLHDADMTEFRQWWSRAERTGHAFEQVHDMHPEYFVRERLRMWIYGLSGPLLVLDLFVFQNGAVTLFLLLLFLYAYIRAAEILIREDRVPLRKAVKIAGLLTISKFPNLLGALRYRLRKWRQRDMAIIEYK